MPVGWQSGPYYADDTPKSSFDSIRTSMNDEMIYQTFINRSDDMAEMRAARADDRPPNYTGS